MTMPLADALAHVLGRPVTDAEVARAAMLGPRALVLLRQDVGPVSPLAYPEQALTVAALRMAARVLEGHALAVTDHDRQTLADDAAALRGSHPFIRGFGHGVPVLSFWWG